MICPHCKKEIENDSIFVQETIFEKSSSNLKKFHWI